MGRGIGIVIVLLLLVASASALTDEQRLAVLAANMQQLGGEQYSLDCGPAKVGDNVLNAAGGIEGPSYCVLSYDGIVVFGTFKEAIATGDDVEVGAFAKDILASYSAFAPHVKPEDMPEDTAIACSPPENWDIDKGFWPCEDIDTDYNTIHIYAYHDQFDTIYLLGSVEDLELGETTAWSAVKDFFKSLFGMESADPGFVNVPPPGFDEFHHAFFSQQGDRNIAAAWDGRVATIVYQGFVTNFSAIPHKSYSLGTDERQRLDVALGAPQDTPQWRRLTSGLRTTEVSGTPIGAVCGNGIKEGFDEECERGIPFNATLACQSKGYIGGTATCNNQTCTINVAGCTCLDADNDTFTNDTLCVRPSYDCDDNLNTTYPGAKEWCDDDIDNDCDGGTDEAGCTEPPTPPPPCNKDDVCDDDEGDWCVDCTAMAKSCPSNWTLVHSRTNYDFYTRVGLRNTSELLIKAKSTQCWLGTESVKRKELYIPTQGKLLVYENRGSQSMRIYASGVPGGWSITGDGEESGSPTGQSCWGCADDECRNLNLHIPNSTATCDPEAACAAKGSRLFSPEDCCNCLIPGGDVCIDDPLGCYGNQPNTGTGAGGGGGSGPISRSDDPEVFK